MSSSYYYFAATLPTLHFNGSTPFSLDVFRSDCQRLLRQEDYEDVERVLGLRFDRPRNGLVIEWQTFIRQIQVEVAWHRLSHEGAGAALNFERGFDPDVVDIINQAFKEEDLFEAEKMVMRLQWDRLERMALNHFFDFEFILIYAEKLKMLERISVCVSEQGKQLFDKIEQNAMKLKDEKIRMFQ